MFSQQLNDAVCDMQSCTGTQSVTVYTTETRVTTRCKQTLLQSYEINLKSRWPDANRCASL